MENFDQRLSVEDLISSLESKQSVDEWLDFSNALVSLGAVSVPALIDCSDNQNSKVRAGTAIILGRLCDPSTFAHLVKLLEDKDTIVRSDAVIALSNFRDENVFDLIIPFLNDEDNEMRACTAEALGHVGDVRGVSHLMELLPIEKDEQVREDTVDALGELGDKRALPLLLATRQTDWNGFVIESADKAIEKLQADQPQQ